MQALNKGELDNVLGMASVNGTSLVKTDLLAIPCEENSKYACYSLATSNRNSTLWTVYGWGE